MNGSKTSTWIGRRSWLVACAAGVVVLLAVVLAFVLGDDEPGTGSRTSADAGVGASSASPSGAPGTTPTPTQIPALPAAPAAGAGGDGDHLPPSLAPVHLEEVATAESGVAARLVAVDGIQATGTGPGNISGPALRVTVRLDNASDRTLDLGGVQVTMSYGADEAPASPVNDPTAASFTGVLPPGASAEGRYVFTVPEDARDVVMVSVGYEAGRPFLVFSGSAP